MSIQVLCSFLNWGKKLFLLDCGNSSSFLFIKSLSDKCFPNIFSHSLDFLFTLLIVSFEIQKFLILMKSNLPIFSFMTYVFVVLVKKPLPNPRS
jgi:hypothetical protein